ncbi:ester cyclase [Streptomyces tubbatahanensis]|uniref:Ester cyclase n=1 Tax=Streptomyces tubbatahanensis TaxID=2923272 RepID=A0ABY3XXY3_9ACTN|nr:ester cyclase [Streptomyces tubbatahanensis]UNS99098.1 ester cyclase [Streptomyces tubbatahanensis]
MTTVHATTAKNLWNAVWNAVESGSLEDLDHFFADDAVFRTSSAEGKGREYAAGVMGRHRAAYPDLRREVLDIVESADGTAVCVEVLFSGTHQGTLVHPQGGRIEPTGRLLQWRAVDKVRVEDGKIREWSALFDRLSMLEQVS